MYLSLVPKRVFDISWHYCADTLQIVSIAQFCLALSPATLPSITGLTRIGARIDITGSRVVDYFFFPAASAARFSSAVGGGNRLACLDILHESTGQRTGSHGHTLPLLLAHNRGSILLGLLELGTGHGVLGFLVGRRTKGSARVSTFGVCRRLAV